MKCKNKFMNDRTCDLCERVNKEDYIECKKIYDDKIALSNKLWDIEHKSPNRESDWDECDKIYVCKLKKWNDDICNPTLECEKYCKENK